MPTPTLTLREQAERQLSILKDADLLRAERPLDAPSGPWCLVNGVSLLNLSSNNYLGFGNDPSTHVTPAELTASTASRLVCGTTAAHLEAEQQLAAFVGHEDAVLFSSGYAANVGVLSALAENDDIIFSDALNHASIIDGCRLARAIVSIYAHRDLADLENRLASQRQHAKNAWIVTESLFSMDGDSPDLQQLARLARQYNAYLVVDEAHALGVLGPEGSGLCRAQEVPADVLVGTLGKAFGLPGAFAATAKPVTDLIRNRARSYVFSTGLAPSVARAIVNMIPVIRGAAHRRSLLLQNAALLRAGLSDLGFEILAGNGPIVPLLVGNSGNAVQLSRALYERRVLAQAIRPPTVPKDTARLRLVPMATHSQADLQFALEAFAASRTQSPR